MRALAIMLTLAGCGRELIITPAALTRVEGESLRACTVFLGWTEAELLDSCGEPVSRVSRAGTDEECLIYDTDAVTFADGMGAPRFAACLGRNPQEMLGVIDRDKRRRGPPVVVGVYAIGSPRVPE